MADVSKKLMGQFADNLSDLIASDVGEFPDEQPEADPSTGARVIDAPEAVPVDLLGTAGAPLLRRLLPAVAVVVVVLVIISIVI